MSTTYATGSHSSQMFTVDRPTARRPLAERPLILLQTSNKGVAPVLDCACGGTTCVPSLRSRRQEGQSIKLQ